MLQNAVRKKQNSQQATGTPTLVSQTPEHTQENPYINDQGIIGNHGILRIHEADVGKKEEESGSEEVQQEDAILRLPERKPEISTKPEAEIPQLEPQPKAPVATVGGLPAEAAVEPEGASKESENAELITAEDPGQILEQLQNVPPVSASAAYGQAQQVSVAALEKQKQDAQEGLPEIPTPTGLSAIDAQSGGKPRLAATKEETPSEFEGEESGREGEIYDTTAEEAPPPSPVRPTVLAGGSGESEERDPELSRSAQNSLESTQLDTRLISTGAGERPAVDMTGEADPAQLNSFRNDSSIEVQNAKVKASGEIYQDFGENAIYPKFTEETLKSEKELSPPKTPAGVEGETPALSGDVASSLNNSLGPVFRERIGEKKTEYDEGKLNYDNDSAQARGEADQDIANLNEEARKKQIQEQDGAKSGVSQLRTQWQTELDTVEQDYQGKANKATEERRTEIEKEKRKGEEKADKHLEEAEKKAETKKQEAERETVREKEKAKKKSKGFWGWVKSAASALIDGLKKIVNSIYDGLRKAVKFIFEAAKKLVLAAIELARKAIVGLIKGLGAVLKGLVSIAFAAFPEIAEKINSKIDQAVDTAVEVVNTIAEGLKKAVAAVLDFLANAIDSLLGLIQSLYNGLFTLIGMIIRGEFGEILRRIGYLVDAAKTAPGQFETAAYEELLGGNLDQPLSPMELAQAGIKPPSATEEAGPREDEAGPMPSAPWSEANVGIDEVEQNMELSPELSYQLLQIAETDGEFEFGESGDESRTMESVMSEVTGQQTTGTAEEQTYPDDGLTPRQRAQARWEVMKQGIAKWWEDNWVTILGGAALALTGFIALNIVTGGAITAALPVIMSVIGPLFVGLTIMQLAGHVRDYLSKGWEGDIQGGGKSLAKALAAGAIELISWLTFKAGGAALKGAKALAKGGVRLAKGAAKMIASGAKYIIKKGKVLFKGIAKSGIGRSAKRLRDMGKSLLNRLRFKKFRIRISGLDFALEGFINPWITIAKGKIKKVPKDTKGAVFRTEKELKSIKEAGKPGTGKITELEVAEYKITKTRGKGARGEVGDKLTGDHIPSRAALVKAEEAKLGRKLTSAEAGRINEEGVTVVIQGKTHSQLSRTYKGRNTQTQIVKDAADLGGAFRRDAEAILKGLKAEGKLTNEAVGAYMEAYRRNVMKGVFKYDAKIDKMFLDFLT